MAQSRDGQDENAARSSGLLKLLSSRVSPGTLLSGSGVSSNAGQAAHLRALTRIAYEDHQEVLKRNIISSHEMDTGILGAETFQDGMGRDEDHGRDKRRRTSRHFSVSAALETSDRTTVSAGGGVNDRHDFDGRNSKRKRKSDPMLSDFGIVPILDDPEAAATHDHSTRELPKGNTERRRAQMRQAQRNYRQRREATIVGLEVRNKQLEEVVDGMTRSFMALQEAAVKHEGLAGVPELAAQIRTSTAEFLGWVRKARRSGGEEGEAEDDGGERVGADRENDEVDDEGVDRAVGGDEGPGEEELQIEEASEAGEEDGPTQEMARIRVVNLQNSRSMLNLYRPL